MNEAGLAALVEVVEDAAAVVDARGVVVLANEAWALMVGTRRSGRAAREPEAAGPAAKGYIESLQVPVDDPGLAAVRDLLDGACDRCETEIGSPNGPWLRLRGVAVNAEHGRLALIRHRDLTGDEGSGLSQERTVHLLRAVAGAQAAFISGLAAQEVLAQLLGRVLGLTRSTYGFIDRLDQEGSGGVVRHPLAVCEAGRGGGLRRPVADPGGSGTKPAEPGTIVGDPTAFEEVVLSSEPDDPVVAGWLPQGHPPVESLLGIPVRVAGRLVGVVGIANRPGGYDEHLLHWLRPFVDAAAGLVGTGCAARTPSVSGAASRRRGGCFQASIETMALPAAVIKNGRFICGNPAAVRLLGFFTSDHLAGEEVLSLVAEGSRERLLGWLEGPAADEKPVSQVLELELMCADGRAPWVEAMLVPIEFADRPATVLLARDVSTERHADGQRHRSGHFANLVANASPGLLYVYDVPSGRNVWANDAHRACLGNGRGPGDLDLTAVIHPDDRAALLDRLDSLAGQEDGSWCDVEYRLRLRDGCWHWYLDRASVLHREADGSVQQLVASAIDISASRRAAELSEVKRRVLDRLARHGPVQEILRAVAISLKEGLGLDAVAIRLRQGNEPPHVVGVGSPAQHLDGACALCIGEGPESVGCAGLDGDCMPAPVCLGRLVIGGTTPAGGQELLSEPGVFWSADLDATLEQLAADQRSEGLRLQCLSMGFRSMALVAIRSDDVVVGLLEVARLEVGGIDEELVGALRGLCSSIGVAVARCWAEEALADSERMLSSVFRAVPDPIIIARLRDGLILNVNDAFLVSSGFNRASLVGRRIEQLDPWIDPDERRELRRVLLRTGELQEAVCSLRRGDGSSRPCLLSARLVDIAGESCVLGVVRDVSGLRRMEESLLRRNRELTLLNWVIGAAAAGMGPGEVLDTACAELATTCAGTRCVGLLVDQRRTTLVAAADSAPTDDPTRLSVSIPLTGGPGYRELVEELQPLDAPDVRRDPRLAELRPMLETLGLVSLAAAPIVVGEELAGCLLLGAAEAQALSPDDVSLLLAVAGQVANTLVRVQMSSERLRLHAALEQSPESVVIWNLDGRIVYVNPAFERTSGFGRQEILGRPESVLRSDHEPPELYAEIAQTLTAGEVWRGHLHSWRKDGSTLIEETVISPIRDEDDQVVSFVAVKHDVTREVELEAQYLKAQKLEGIGRLAGGVAHDFNNLLGAILGYAELLERLLAEQPPLLEMVQQIIDTAVHATGIVRQLLLFARREATKMQVVELNGLLASITGILRRMIGEDIQLDVRCTSEPLRTEADPSQLEQVVLNLVVNARDAMPDGGRLVVSIRELALDAAESVRFGNLPPGRYVAIAVVDSGVGISESVQQKMFEPFFTTKDREKGTGLGLSTCFGIVSRYGGHLHVSSKVGCGATMTALLPLAEAEESAVADEPAVRSIEAGSGVVLLVEDDDAIRRLVSMALQDIGYTVVLAADGDEALRLAAELERGPDILITDVVMPRLGGPALAMRLREQHPELPVVFVTGYAGDLISEHEITDPLLYKPFSVARLAEAVRSSLEQSASSPPNVR